jgi:hypothetical protein
MSMRRSHEVPQYLAPTGSLEATDNSELSGQTKRSPLAATRLGPTFGLTNAELWLQFPQFAPDFGEVVYRRQGVRVVVAEHPPGGGQGPACGLLLPAASGLPHGCGAGCNYQGANPGEQLGQEPVRLGERGEVAGVGDQRQLLGRRLDLFEVLLGQGG